MRICRLLGHEKELLEEIKKGSIFVYPTDTLYGLGCSALSKESVQKIRRMKGTEHPFSVIAPSKKWIEENMVIIHRSYLKKLPGKYTLILKKKKKGFLKDACAKESLGVRIPNHRFTSLIKNAGVPFITTSVNISGKKPMKKVSEIPETFLKDIDFVIEAGTLNRSPSEVYDLTGEKPRKLR